MTIKSVLTDVAILAAAAAISFGIGYARGDIDGNASGLSKGNAKLQTVETSLHTSEDNNQRLQTSLNQVQRQLALQRQQLQDAQAVASAALAQRDVLQGQLAASAAQRIATDRKIAHATPDCAALEQLAICPDLARRLWPAPGQADRAPGGADDH